MDKQAILAELKSVIITTTDDFDIIIDVDMPYSVFVGKLEQLASTPQADKPRGAAKIVSITQPIEQFPAAYDFETDKQPPTD